MVAPNIKNGSRYQIRGQDAAVERRTSSFDNSVAEVNVEANKPIETSSSETRNAIENQSTVHMRILAEAVLKLRRRNDKLEEENKKLKLQLQLNCDEKSDETENEPMKSICSDDIQDTEKPAEDKDDFSPDELTKIESALSQASHAEVLQNDAPLATLSSKSHDSDFLAVSASASISECESHAAEVEKLHKVIEDNNIVISDLMSRVTELSDTVKQNECTFGLMQAKLDEHKESVSRINEAKQDVLDQLGEKRTKMVELENKLKEVVEENADAIRKTKDLEMSVTDRTFLAAELRRELNEAREEKAKMIERRQEDVRKLVREKMVFAEKYLRREVRASMLEVKRKEMDAVLEELLTVEARSREMREKIQNGHFDICQLGDEGMEDISTTVPITSSTSSGDENNDEVLDPWFAQIREENKDRVLQSAPSDELSRVPDVMHNLNDLQASLDFSEKINDMTFSAIKEKVARASRMVVKMKEGVKVISKEKSWKTTGTTKETSSPSPLRENHASSLSQEWEDYHDERRQKQEEGKTTFEREAINLANAIRKHTSMLGGFLEK